ncbi:MAG: universal stress protein [Mycobacterium sp.]|nr:universal stress protein [Mycobacterium sp.]
MRTRNSRFGILVGIDDSAEARAAVRWAIDTAAMHNLPLTVVHVLQESEAHCTAWGLTSAPKPIQSDPQVEHDVESLVDSAMAIIDESTATEAFGFIRTRLHPSPTTATLADLSSDADMVVLGGAARHAFPPTPRFSIGVDLARHARCPVAIVRGAASTQPCALPVVVGIDGSPASESAIAIAFDEASSRGVELVALYVASSHATIELAGTTLAPDTSGQEILAERLAGWGEQYPDVVVRPLVAWGDPAHRLLEEAEAAQLLVVGSHGCPPLTSALLGSVSSAVVADATVPVIVARQP